MVERGPSPDPYALPPELTEAIKDDTYACVTIATDQGTAMLIKAPTHEINQLRGTLPIQLRHELFEHPASPVIRMTATIYDDPQRPFLAETFINIEDPDQRAGYATLAQQGELRLLFYDGELHFQLAKVVPNGTRERVPFVLAAASALLAQIPPEQVDFDRARRAVIAAMELQ